MKPEQDSAPARLHTPFLERAGSDDCGIDSQLALGAFLTLRAVDVVARGHTDHDAFEYQISALDQFLNDFPMDPELQNLSDISAALAASQTGSFESLWTALLDYENYLEGEFRLDEGHDVMATACACAAVRDPAALPKMELRRGRVLRRAGHFDESAAAYGYAGDLARKLNDDSLERLSRIGRSMVFQNTGNLPAAEKLLLEVVADAVQADDLDAEAIGGHDLAMNYIKRGDAGKAVPLAYRAYCLYDNDEQRYRAIGDLGMALYQLGHLTAARDAHELVIAGPVSSGMRITTLLELLDITAALQDRMGFERIRREIAILEKSLPPDWAADFCFKLGRGFRDFGQLELAKTYLERTIAFASEKEVHQYAFEAEKVLEEIASADHAPKPTSRPTPYRFAAEVEKVAQELHHLRMT